MTVVPLPRFALSTVGSVARQARLGLADFDADQLAFLTYGRGLDTRRMREVLGFTTSYTTEAAVAELAETMPPAARHLDRLRERGGRVVVVDPRRTPTAERADLFLQPLPGGDLALALGLLHLLDAAGAVDEAYVEQRTTGFDVVRRTVATWWPERVERVTGVPVDELRSLASLVGLVALVFAIIEGPDRGWTSAITVGTFAVSAVALVGFVRWELRNPEPMLDMRLFRLPGFRIGTLAITTQFFASFGFFYIVLQYLQYIAGRSPLGAAVALLPLPAVLIPVARSAPRLADRFGLNRVVALGLTLSASGMLVTPERRMSSAVMTNTEAGVLRRLSAMRDAEVILSSASCSMLRSSSSAPSGSATAFAAAHRAATRRTARSDEDGAM